MEIGQIVGYLNHCLIKVYILERMDPIAGFAGSFCVDPPTTGIAYEEQEAPLHAHQIAPGWTLTSGVDRD